MSELLNPFVAAADLSPTLVEQLQLYLDLLLRWNARVNLTAVRPPEQIVTRHFGESLFAAQVLKNSGPTGALHLADVGSGAGFPGFPSRCSRPKSS